jgi:hypothetical protein
MKNYAYQLFALAVATTAMAAPASAAQPVKMSKSGICHDAGSRSFKRTKNFTGFRSMAECLQHGRAYKGYSGAARNVKRGVSSAKPVERNRTTKTSQRQSKGVPYDRHLYDHWIDADRDCQNQRHEILQELSTGRITLSKNGCRVVRGRWNDPYTGEIFMNSKDLDIDHMVPLAYAHARGSHSWDADKRRQFANDPVNLFAVKASENRAKGAKGPLEWLPPNKDYQCSYVTRFHRIMKTYDLEYADWEKAKITSLRAKLCEK